MTDGSDFLIFGINPELWVKGCIEKVEASDDWKARWNSAWFETYTELGGKKESIGKKGCPKNCVKGLYEFGRIKGTSQPYQQADINVLQDKYGYKNAVYGLAACDKLRNGSYETHSELAGDVYSSLQDLHGMDVPKNGDQGPVKITYMLNDLSLLQLL
jgi:hypothetical protein